MNIILASNSPRRKEILEQLKINFKAISSNFNEEMKALPPNELAEYFAFMKAKDVAQRVGSSCIVIGADTVVYSEEIMGKPKDKDEAYRMLKKLSGKEHLVITGVSIIDTNSLRSETQSEITKVKFKTLKDEEIRFYIDTGEPMDKAGAYAIQGYGALFVEKIEGCYFNVVGLPIYRLSLMLEKFGFNILG